MLRRHPFILALSLPLFALSLPSLAAGDGSWKSGEETYQKVCAYCHDAGVSPILRGRQLPPELIKHFVRNGSRAMPAFRATLISDTDLDALAAWLQKSAAPAASENIPKTSAAGTLPAKESATTATDTNTTDKAEKAADATESTPAATTANAAPATPASATPTSATPTKE